MLLQKLQSLFLYLPVVKFKLIGNSMYPTLGENEVVLVNRLSYLYRDPEVNEIVVVMYSKQREKKCILKRVKRIKIIKEKKLFFIEGDNKKESTDSRNFGWITKDEIIGKVIRSISNI